jgi:hypothetical protein
MRSSHSPVNQVIHIHVQAATKPAMGAPCNGCGLCCLAEPCPLGVLLSRSRRGPCKALQWGEVDAQYRCGALGSVVSLQPGSGWAPLRWVQAGLNRLRRRVVLRWIAAGAGCDCDLEPSPSRTMGASSPNPSDLPHD